MKPAFSTWLEVARTLAHRYRTRLPLYMLVAALIAATGIVLPAQLMPWERWLLLLSSLALVVVCIDFNAMLWRIYRRRSDLFGVRHTLALIGGFVILVALGRVVGFASLYFSEVLQVVSVINLLSAVVATVLVVNSQQVETYASTMPQLADLQAVNTDLMEARQQLQVREELALEGMMVLGDDTIIEANHEAYNILGYNEAEHELIGMRVHQIVHEDYSRQAYQQLKQRHSEAYFTKVICKDGTIKHVEAAGRNMHRADVEVRLTFFRDVSLEHRCLTLLGGQMEGRTVSNEALVRTMDELRLYFHKPSTGTQSYAAR